MSGVLVLGRSLPALAAALEFAEVGIGVTIASSSPRLPQGEVRDASGDVARLLEDVAAPIADGVGANPEAAPVRSHPAPVLLAAKQGALRRPPAPAVWGIPTAALSADSIAFLGTRAALRVYLDRLKPVLTIGKQENLAKLISARIGSSALQLLVEPLVFERLGVSASEAEVSVVAPGLDEAITRAGTLTGGAAWLLDVHLEREALVEPAAGWADFGERLLARLALYGAELIEPEAEGDDPEVLEAGAEEALADWDRADFDAIIVDAGAASEIDPAGELGFDAEFAHDLAALSPARVRVYAEIGIESPASPSEAGQAGFLRLVPSRRGEVWAVRAMPDRDGRWIARLSGPSAVADEFDAVVARAVVAEVLGELSLEASGEPRVHLSAAPYATRAQRAERETMLDAWHESHPDAIACGEELHGDSLGLAIADARRRAIELRRRILGIAE